MEAKSKLHLSAHTNAPLELERMMSPSTELLNSIEEQNNFPQLDSCIVTVSYYRYLCAVENLRSHVSGNIQQLLTFIEILRTRLKHT